MLLKRKDTFSVRRGRHCEGVRPSRSARVVGERGAGGSEASPAHRRARSGWRSSVLEQRVRYGLMEAAKRLKLERFGLPNKPSGTPAHRRWVGAESENKPTGTPEQLEELVRCGIGG